MTEARLYSIALAVTAVGMIGAAQAARADDTARTWGQSMSYSSPSRQALDFNKAQAEYLLRNGITPGASITRCEVAGACQNGGTATNISGYSEVTNNGDGSNITIDVDSDADQDATSVNSTADDIGDIVIN